MTPRPASLAIVGAGPRGVGILERLSANYGAVAPATAPLVVHLVDPFPPGGGRVWRADQSELLLMNSMAADVTVFTDDSVTCEGEIRPGPSMYEWALALRGDGPVAALSPPGPPELDAELTAEVAGLGPVTFPSRRLANRYLRWFYDKVVAELPDEVRVVEHRARAVGLADREGGPAATQRLTLDDGEVLDVDVVVLAVGHLDTVPRAAGRLARLDANPLEDPSEAAAPAGTAETPAEFAERRGATYLAPHYAADVDYAALADLAGGEPVIVRGLGLSFVDLVVLLTEGRGGRFRPKPGATRSGQLDYVASGDEPVLYAGSRRGVPHLAKLTYALQAPRAPLPRYLVPEALGDRLEDPRPLDFRRELWPLVAKELSFAYYHELFHAHRDRVRTSFEELTAAIDETAWGTAAWDELFDRSVVDPVDVFDLERLDRPLGRPPATDLAGVQAQVRGVIERDVLRRTDPRFSADLGAFNGFLSAFVSLPAFARALSHRSRVEALQNWWFGFFSYYASGPPVHRLEEQLALSDAGVVRYLGRGLEVATDDASGRFVARSASLDGEVRARMLVEARLPRPSLHEADDALLRSLTRTGEASEEVLVDEDDDFRHATGLLRVARHGLRLVDEQAREHPRRFAAGSYTSNRAAAAFSRPRVNSPAFRQNDALARELLAAVADAAGAAASSGESPAALTITH